MHRDPTFDQVYWLECKAIKQQSGCQSCIYRGDHLAWNKYQCAIGNQINQYGSCKVWQFREQL